MIRQLAIVFFVSLFPAWVQASSPSVSECHDLIQDILSTRNVSKGIGPNEVEDEFYQQFQKEVQGYFQSRFKTDQSLIDALTYRPAPYLTVYTPSDAEIKVLSEALGREINSASLKKHKSVLKTRPIGELFKAEYNKDGIDFFKKMSTDQIEAFSIFRMEDSSYWRSDFKIDAALNKNSKIYKTLLDKNSDFYKDQNYRNRFLDSLSTYVQRDDDLVHFFEVLKNTFKKDEDLVKSIHDYAVTILERNRKGERALSENSRKSLVAYLTKSLPIDDAQLSRLKFALNDTPTFQNLFNILLSKHRGENGIKVLLQSDKPTSNFEEIHSYLEFLNTENRKKALDIFKEVIFKEFDKVEIPANLEARLQLHFPGLVQDYNQEYINRPGVIFKKFDSEDQKNIEVSLTDMRKNVKNIQTIPKGFANLNAYLESIPEGLRYDFVSKLLAELNSTQSISETISSIKPMSGTVEGVLDFFLYGKGSEFVSSNRTSFTQEQVLAMFGGPRFASFFPHLVGKEITGAVRTKFTLGLRTSPRARNGLNTDWLREKVLDSEVSDSFIEAWGFRPALSHLRLANQMNDFRATSRYIDQSRGLTVQGFYENQNISWFQRLATRGDAQLEDDAPRLLRSLERDLASNNGALGTMTPFEQRMFVYQWGGLNADASLIDTIRNRAIVIANRNSSFYNLRVEIHNFPNIDVLKRVEEFKENLVSKNGDSETIEQLEMIINEIRSVLGIGGKQGLQFNETIGTLPLSAGNKEKLLQLVVNYKDLNGHKKLNKLVEVREQFENLKLNGSSERKNIEKYLGDRKLSEESMAVSSDLISRIGLPKNETEFKQTFDTVRTMLKHVELDDMLTEAQISEVNKALRDIEQSNTMALEKKLELSLSVLRNAVDQVYYNLDRTYGKIDGIIYSAHGHGKNPIRFIDGTMRSQNIFILSQLVDKFDSALAISRKVKHSVKGKELVAPVEVFNPGETIGILRVNKNPMELTEKEIGVFSEMPSETGALSGIITLGVGARLSHLQLLAKSLQIPNAKVSKEYLDVLKELDGKQVKFKTTKEGQLLIEEVSEIGKSVSKVDRVEVPKANYAINRPIGFTEAGNTQHHSIAGPKGIQLSKMFLNPALKGHVPDGFILPFGFFKRYADEIGLTPYIDQLSKVNLENKNLISLLTARIRKMIDDNPIPDSLLNEVQESMNELSKRVPEAKGYFFRSDTNIEDLPNFNGAGLNESVPNVSSNSSSMNDAIRTVWKSPFKEKSIFWRGMALGQPNVAIAEPSVVVMPTVEAQSSGVILSRGGKSWDLGKGYISANWGIGSVVEAGRPVEEITMESGKKIRFSFTVSDQRPVAKEGGGIVMESVTPGMPVLKDDQIEELNRLAKVVDRSLGESPHGWDIEWAVDQNGKIIILQARPNM